METPMNLPTAPGTPFNFAQHLLATNESRAAKPAFVDDAGALRYGELDERVRRLAAGLRALGIKREERVLLLMQDGTDWPVAFLGAIYAGIVPVAVNTLLTADDYAYMLEHSRAQAALVSGALLPALATALIKSDHEVQRVIVSRPLAPLKAAHSADPPLKAAHSADPPLKAAHSADHPPKAAHSGDEALDAAQAGDAPTSSAAAAAALPQPPEVEFGAFVAAHAPMARPAATGPDDPAFWLYSSGSTGRPKGTVHSHANPYWTCELYGKAILGLRKDDVCYSAAKLFFAYGLGNALTFPMSVGATVLLMAERPTPDAVFRRWRGEVGGLQPTVFYGAPTGYAGMLASPNLPAREAIALRLASSAGEALPAEIGLRFQRQYGVDIVDGIGSTEMLHIFISNRPDRVRYGTTGWPVPGYEIQLRGDDGGPVPDGEPGDLYIHGPSAALMYWGNRAKTADTFLGGWTRAGDKYVRNPDGSYTYSGRSDDMLKVSGIYVSPFEVEATLVQHPAVLEAAVIGKVDAEGLTKTKAFVVLKPGGQATEEELKAFVKDRLAPYKYPRYIEFVAELPKTATGKIQRYKLREREAAR
jgi:benzoate-CoA ligase